MNSDVKGVVSYSDLPKLASITSNGMSFYFPHSISLTGDASLFQLMVDIPNAEIVKLPNSFQRVQTKLITSSDWYYVDE